jgi:ribonuclease BN (tRNA processing enzyme)
MPKLTFIGTSDAFNHGGRGNSCYWVEDELGQYMVDCGPTAPAIIEKAGLETEHLDAIFFTHLHGDHIAGIPGVLLHLLFKDRRTRDFYIIGPQGTEQRLKALLDVCYPHLLDKSLPFQIHYLHFDLKSEPAAQTIQVFLGRQLTIIHAKHDPHVNPTSFKIQALGQAQSITFSGDTGWQQALADLSDQSDILICECSYDLPYYDGHLSIEEFKKYRQLIHSKVLYLSHLSEASRKLALALKDQYQWHVAEDLMQLEF